MEKIKHVFIFILIAISMSCSASAQGTDIGLYAFGHSLIDHRPPSIPTPSDETTVLHWIYDMVASSEHSFAGGGQYGFLTTHDDLPPIAQWGYDIVPSVWNDQMQSFSESDINTIFITAANFIQYVGPTEPHPLDGNTTVVQATSDIFEWVAEQGNSCRYYIYANWPEMDLTQAYPPNLPDQSEIDAYHVETATSFMDWWIDYQDEMLLIQPESNARLIPVGGIISKFLTSELGQDIAFDELYEDSDPHGRANIYFLAGMISYMSIYSEKPVSTYDPGEIIHTDIRAQLPEIIDFIWEELLDFNFADGSSRVFTSTVNLYNNKEAKLEVIPNPSVESFVVRGQEIGQQVLIFDIHGLLIYECITSTQEQVFDSSHFQEGIYFVEVVDPQKGRVGTARIVKLK